MRRRTAARSARNSASRTCSKAACSTPATRCVSSPHSCAVQTGARSYDRPYDDLFALQDELTAAVAAALKAKLLPATDAHPLGGRPPSGNLEAYAALLRGRFHADRRTEADQRKAIEELSRATQLDPGYADA